MLVDTGPPKREAKLNYYSDIEIEIVNEEEEDEEECSYHSKLKKHENMGKYD